MYMTSYSRPENLFLDSILDYIRKKGEYPQGVNSSVVKSLIPQSSGDNSPRCQNLTEESGWIGPLLYKQASSWIVPLPSNGPEGDKNILSTNAMFKWSTDSEVPKDFVVLNAKTEDKTFRVAIPRCIAVANSFVQNDKTEFKQMLSPEKTWQAFCQFSTAILCSHFKEPNNFIPTIKPLEDCTKKDWFPAKARKLSATTPSLMLTTINLVNRTPKSFPETFRFISHSGSFLQDGSSINSWTANMIMRKMKTFVFSPFPAKIVTRTTPNSKGDIEDVAVCMRIPAFTEEQARTIMAKRLYEGFKMTFKDQELLASNFLYELGYTDEQIELEINGKRKEYIGLPPLDSIPLIGTDFVSITDFFPLDFAPDSIRNPLATPPFFNGLWTLEDLGFAFYILFARELGLWCQNRFIAKDTGLTLPTP